MSGIFTERVAKGAALLDEKRPGWVDRIDLDTLDIDNCEDCVLGQAFEAEVHDDENCGYTDGLEALGIPSGRPEEDFGFDAHRADQASLTAEWKRVITARREASA